MMFTINQTATKLGNYHWLECEKVVKESLV